ncbi:MAG: SPFH domain-containing protein [Ilumatobacteraceae bacterium]
MIVAVIIAALAIVGLAFLIGAVKIVRPYQRGLVERLGKYRATRDPGLNLIIPFIETMQLVDMREQVVDVPPQEVITSDNVVVSVDAVVYYEATDPQRLVYNVADFFTAITKLAQTNLRNLIGDLELDRALTSRDTINTQLREVLDDATDKWGSGSCGSRSSGSILRRKSSPRCTPRCERARPPGHGDRGPGLPRSRHRPSRRREAVVRARRRGTQASQHPRRRR